MADYLEMQLQQGTLTLCGLQQYFQLLRPTPLPTVDVTQHELSDYDQLLNASTQPTSSEQQPQCQPQPAAQTAPYPRC